MAKRRIFTKYLTAGPFVFTGTIVVEHHAATIWTVEEDIEIVGCQLVGEVHYQSQNDGTASTAIEVSQTGQGARDGMILSGRVLEQWNTVPAFGAIHELNVVVMLPEDQIIPVKEGGSIYMNAYTSGKTAGNTSTGFGTIIYYRKKGS